jgi:hypothetical protein
MNKKIIKICIVAALLLVLILPTPILAKQTVKENDQLVLQPSARTLDRRPIIDIHISYKIFNHTFWINITLRPEATSNVTNIDVLGNSTTLRGRAVGDNTVNTTIPSIAPGQTILIKVPAQKGFAIKTYSVNAQYLYNGTIEQPTYGPDKYLLFFGFPFDLKG